MRTDVQAPSDLPRRGRIGVAAAAFVLLAAVVAPPPAAAQGHEHDHDHGHGHEHAQETATRETTPEAEATRRRVAEAMASAGEDPAAAGRARLAEVHDYLSRDGGRWRARNAEHVPGASTPVEFGYEFDWVLDRTAVSTRIFGVLEDGSEETYWRALTTWHPGDKQVVVYSLSRDGDVSRGPYEVVDEQLHRLHLTVTTPTGEAFQIRDDMKILGPDRFEATTSMRRDGEWVVLEKQDWRRIESGG